MANKNVNILLKLQDQFTRPMREAGTITKAQATAMTKVSTKAIGLSRNLRSAFIGGAAHAAKFGLAIAGVSGVLSVAGIKSYCSSAIEGFNSAQEAAAKLESVLGNVPSIIAQGGGAAGDAAKRLSDYAAELSKAGVIGKTTAVSGLQQLATFQLTESSLKQLLPGMEDLLAQQKGVNATNEDAIAIANLVGKAMSGQTGALSRAGIIMNDYQKKVMQTGNEQERAAMMAEILKQNVGGVNAALAETATGKIKVLQNQLAGMKATIGGRLMDLKSQIIDVAAQYIPMVQAAALKLIDMVQPKIEAGIKWFSDHTEDVKAAVGRVKDMVVSAWAKIQPVLVWAKEHARTLIPTILGVTAAFTGISVVADVANKVHGLYTAFKDIKTAASGVHDMLGKLKITGFSPVLLIIGAVIAAGVLLYKHWDVIKPKLVELKDKFVSVFTKVRDVVTGAFDKIKSIAMPILDAIRTALEKIKSFIDTVKEGMAGLGFGSGSSWGANTNGYVSKADWSATGTPYWRGGPTYVNEGRRGEIINLPSGTQIIPHDVSMAAAKGGGVTINAPVTIQGNVIGNRQFADQIGEHICRKVLNAMQTIA